MAARRGFEESDSDDDSSVASDWTVQSEDRESYPVDHILAEKEGEPGQTLYLVKWTGYPESRNSWEPETNLMESTKSQWLEKTIAIGSGFDQPFDIVTWERKQKAIKDANERRWEQRKRKLAKQKRSTEPPEDHPAAEAEAESDSSSEIEGPGLFVSPLKADTTAPAVGRKTTAAQLRSRAQTANRASKQAQSKVVERKRGADIMANFGTEPPPKRKRKVDENKFYNMSHAWNVQKASRDGAVPKAGEIPLGRPGEVQWLSFTKSSVPAKSSETRSSPSETRRSSVADGPRDPDAGNIPLTCYYWYHEITCPAGERKCLFSHRQQDRVAEKAIHEQALEKGQAFKPKFYSPTEVCFYWARGKCFQGDTGCWFAHWYPSNGSWLKYPFNDRDKMQERSGPEPKPRSSHNVPGVCKFWLQGTCWNSAEACSRRHEHPEPATATIQQPAQKLTRKLSNMVPPHKILKTCPYWLRANFCKQTAETCRFMHEIVDEVASFRSKTKVCPYWASGFCRKSAEECMYLHEHLGDAPMAALPPNSQLGPRSSSRRQKCDSYRPPALQTQYHSDEVKPALTMNNSDQPQSLLGFAGQSSNGVAPGTLDYDRNLPAPSDYYQHLAQASDDRASLKIQVTQAYSPQILPLTSGPGEALFNSPPSFLEEPGADSSDAMDIESGSVCLPDCLNVFFQLPEAPESVPAHIVDLDTSTTEALRTEFSMAPEFTLSNTCMRELLEEFTIPLAPTIMSAGQVLEAEGQDTMQLLASTLTEHRSVAIVQGSSLLLIFYPSNLKLQDGVILERKVMLLPNCHICVEVRTTGSTFPGIVPPASSSSSRTLERLFLKNHGWKPKDFFFWPPDRNVARNVAKNVYIMAHPTAHKSETEMLARYFRELQASVWLPGTKGSWRDFQNSTEEGVIIFHPDFSSYECVPGLRAKLLGKFNIFQLGVEMKASIPSRLHFKKIMTRGTCTLLTDEMYAQLPLESLNLLKLIAKKNEGKTKSSRTWGVYGRPRLTDFLLDLLETEGEDEAKKAARIELFDVAEMLEDKDPGAPLLSSEIMIDPSEAAGFSEFRNEDPAQAAWKLLEAFATESLNWSDDYRRIVVVHPAKGVVDPSIKRVFEEWEASPRAQHITFMLPDKFMSKFPLIPA